MEANQKSHLISNIEGPGSNYLGCLTVPAYAIMLPWHKLSFRSMYPHT